MCKPDCCCGECKPVLVYKDTRGTYHESKAACLASNERIKKEQEARDRDNALRHTFDCALGNDPMYYRLDYHFSSGYNSPKDYWLSQLMTNWKSIRDNLNKIKE